MFDEFGNAPVRDRDALLEHEGPRAEGLDLVHVVRGEDYGRSLPLYEADVVPDLPAGHWVETRGEFVEEDEPGFVHEGHKEGELLFFPARKGFDRLFPPFFEAKAHEEGLSVCRGGVEGGRHAKLEVSFEFS